MPLKFNPLTASLDIVNPAATGGISHGAADPTLPTSYTFFYNTTDHALKVYLFDSWVTFINFKDIMLTDESGSLVTDQTGNPLLETTIMDFIRA